MDKRKHDPLYDVENLASATECTGLMPAMPPSADGAEELTAMMAIHCPPGMGAGGEAHQWTHAVEHPSDEHNPRRNAPNTRPAMRYTQNHPQQGRNPAWTSPSPAGER